MHLGTYLCIMDTAMHKFAMEGNLLILFLIVSVYTVSGLNGLQWEAQILIGICGFTYLFVIPR